MKKIKPPFTKYPGNRWMARQVEKTGSESSIPFIHGVVRGALANPSTVDPGAVLEEVFKDAEPEGLFNDNFDKLSMAFLFLYNDTARSLTSSRPLPQALSSDIRTEAGWHFLLLEVSDLADGFVRGFNLKELPDKQRLVFKLKVFEGMEIKEIARAMGTAEGTVKSHLFRATRFLREELKEWAQF